MTQDDTATPPKQPMINEIEREAIEFAQSLLSGPKKGEADKLSKIERNAIDFAKKLLGRFEK